jgi:hypothetical protein
MIFEHSISLRFKSIDQQLLMSTLKKHLFIKKKWGYKCTDWLIVYQCIDLFTAI